MGDRSGNGAEEDLMGDVVREPAIGGDAAGEGTGPSDSSAALVIGGIGRSEGPWGGPADPAPFNTESVVTGEHTPKDGQKTGPVGAAASHGAYAAKKTEEAEEQIAHKKSEKTTEQSGKKPTSPSSPQWPEEAEDSVKISDKTCVNSQQISEKTGKDLENKEQSKKGVEKSEKERDATSVEGNRANIVAESEASQDKRPKQQATNLVVDTSTRNRANEVRDKTPIPCKKRGDIFDAEDFVKGLTVDQNQESDHMRDTNNRINNSVNIFDGTPSMQYNLANYAGENTPATPTLLRNSFGGDRLHKARCSAITEFDLQEHFNEKRKGVDYRDQTYRHFRKWMLGQIYPLSRLFPLKTHLRNYKIADFSIDVVAGISEGIMAVPQGMSYALLAGMPVVHGLYNGLIYPIVYALLGTSVFACAGVSAIEAVLCEEVVTGIIGENAPQEFRTNVSIMLCSAVAIVSIAMRLLGLSVIADFLSNPMLSGFSTASAFLIGTKQLAHIFGLTGVSSDWLLVEWYNIISHIHKSNPFAILIGFLSTLCLFTVKHFNRRYAYLRRYPIPGPLIVIIIFTLLTNIAKLHTEPIHLKCIGHIPDVLPMPTSPFGVQIPPDTDSYKYPGKRNHLYLDVFTGAILLTATYFVVHVSIVKLFYRKQSLIVDAAFDAQQLAEFEGWEKAPGPSQPTTADPGGLPLRGNDMAELYGKRAICGISRDYGVNETASNSCRETFSLDDSIRREITSAEPTSPAEGNKGSTRDNSPKKAVNTTSDSDQHGKSLLKKKMAKRAAKMWGSICIGWEKGTKKIGCGDFLAASVKTKASYLDIDQDLIALGVANFVGCFFLCFPNATSLSRTSVTFSIGASSPLHGLYAATIMLLTLLYITPLLRNLPMAVLGSIVLVGVSGITDFRHAYALSQLGGLDFVVWLAAFLITILFGPKWGIIATILLSLIWLLKRTCRPTTAVLGRLPGTSIYRNVERFPLAQQYAGILIIRWDAALNFANADYFEKMIVAHIQQANLKCIIQHKLSHSPTGPYPTGHFNNAFTMSGSVQIQSPKSVGGTVAGGIYKGPTCGGGIGGMPERGLHGQIVAERDTQGKVLSPQLATPVQKSPPMEQGVVSNLAKESPFSAAMGQVSISPQHMGALSPAGTTDPVGVRTLSLQRINTLSPGKRVATIDSFVLSMSDADMAKEEVMEDIVSDSELARDKLIEAEGPMEGEDRDYVGYPSQSNFDHAVLTEEDIRRNIFSPRSAIVSPYSNVSTGGTQTAKMITHRSHTRLQGSQEIMRTNLENKLRRMNSNTVYSSYNKRITNMMEATPDRQYLRSASDTPRSRRVHTLILDTSAIHSVDETALASIESLLKRLNHQKVTLLFANWKGPMRDFLDRADFYKRCVPLSRCFLSLHDAVTYAYTGQSLHPAHDK